MTREELRAIRQKLGLSQLALAEKVGVSLRAVVHWEGGTRKIPEPAARLIASLEQPRR